MVAIIVAHLAVRNKREIDIQTRARADIELRGNADPQGFPDHLVGDHQHVVRYVAPDETEMVGRPISIDGFAPLAVTDKRDDRQPLGVEDPVRAPDVDRPVANAPARYRGRGVRELDLPGVEVFVAENAPIHRPDPEETLEKPVAEITATEYLERIGVEVFIEQDRGRVAKRGIQGLGVVTALGIAGARPITHTRLAARRTLERGLGERRARRCGEHDQPAEFFTFFHLLATVRVHLRLWNPVDVRHYALFRRPSISVGFSRQNAS